MKKMYHEYSKNSNYVREALYKVYGEKCAYCDHGIKLRYMHVDHILPTNRPDVDEETRSYIKELKEKGFIQDSLENYLPTCSSCNRKKSNQVYSVSNLIFLHERAKKNLAKVLSLIEKAQNDPRKEEYFYEPVDSSIWEELTFDYQRDLSHAIMGYRLTSADVNACPSFPQVDRITKQLNIVDYAVIQGETGCGKSISMFQVAYRLFSIGWKVYILKLGFDDEGILLPNNTENSLYLIDDAQTYSDSLIAQIQSQARMNRKVLFARTISESINPDSIILTNRDSVDILYRDFLKRKDEVLSIVKQLDNTVGVNFLDLPIEQRIEEANGANSPWQFSYILRGGWRTMKEAYKAVGDHNDCDLLVAAIAVFQIMQLDKAVDLTRIYRKIKEINPAYRWTESDVEFLVERKIIISKNDIRIVHLESASVITALFFDEKKSEKQSLLIRIIEKAFINNEISPLGLVWLCNGCKRYSRELWATDELFITDEIIRNVSVKLNEIHSSEEVRDIMYLLNKIIMLGDKGKGINIVLNNEARILELANKADGISAWGFGEILNSLFNYDKVLHNLFSNQIIWKDLMKRMRLEESTNYYAWGRMFNRGLALLRRKECIVYSDAIYELVKALISNATMHNVVEITSFLCSISFLIPVRLHKLIKKLVSLYEQCFSANIEGIKDILSYDFISIICGVDFWDNRKPLPEQENTAKAIINVIPDVKLANYISNSNMQEWISIRYILYFLYYFDFKKYSIVIKQLELSQLSNMTRYSWDRCYEVSMIIETLATADVSIAKDYIVMNTERIEHLYPAMIIIDPDFAIKLNVEKGRKLDLTAGESWEDRMVALKALSKTNKQFTIEYLKGIENVIIDLYSNVRALDFTERFPLDFLNEIRKLDGELYNTIVKNIDRKNVEKNWDLCGGIQPRKKRWVDKRKEEYFKIIGLHA